MQKEMEKELRTSRKTAIFQLFADELDANLPDLAILRCAKSAKPFFVSAGWAIDFEHAAKFALLCIDRNPIRLVG